MALRIVIMTRCNSNRNSVLACMHMTTCFCAGYVTDSLLILSDSVLSAALDYTT
jgi:hypothetical protein